MYVWCSERKWCPCTQLAPVIIGTYLIARSHLSDLNTPPQTGARPMSLVCFLWFGCGSTFIKMSAVCSGSWILSMFIMPSWTRSWTQCQCISMCFDLLWNWGFFVIAIAPLLSPSTSIGNSLGNNPSSLYKFCSQQALHADSKSATYSASIEDSAIAICFFELHVIALSATRNTYPVVDFLLSALPYVLRSKNL